MLRKRLISIEDFEELNISKRNKEYFEAIQEDYKACRKKAYEHVELRRSHFIK